ncbi:glycosyltransferase family 4 protein [Waterburya agarophytonicola K14]|uniref:Glycosyltransferase family 4 protein n=1 Tax=Waterburya agarophytonicola KI4 TaxID=2874699 RepID=A0A964BRZ1_9CYAN|nr:glycosyltransferase family 4 protein [Waterburya agarophytonicola]MCC0177756.1 glycosyltransferase family 4 protein [Waterburya agarophytonicola KI4]
MTYKLLIVTTVPITIRSFLLPFVHHFKSLGWQVDSMAQGVSEDEECVAACDRVWDIQWSRNVLDPQNLLSGVKRVKEVVTQGDYDLVHVHTPIAAFVTRFALRNLTKPKVVYTAHGFHFYRGGSPIKNAIFFNLEKLAGSWTDYLITINHEDATAAKKHNFLPEERIYYTRGIGVDTKRYASNRVSEADVMEVRQELNLGATDVLLLSIAEFTPRKRHQDLLNALAKLDNSQVHLALAGEGPLMEQMKELAQELNIDEQIHFLGFRKDIPTLIQAATAVLLVSQQEGLPRSIMEAMCLNTPVIGTNIRGTQDLLEDGCGLLVELGDTDDLARAMAHIVSDSDSAAAIAQKAQVKMVDYDIEQIIQEYSRIFDLALN